MPGLNITPSLPQVLDKVIETKLLDLHTALPAEVLSYDPAKNLATVRPLLKRKYKDELLPVSLPTISNVPISFLRMGPAHVRLPVKPGQTGMIIFSERSIDGWLVSGGNVDPGDPRRHHLSDAVFYPGLNPANNPMISTAPSTSLEIKLNNAYMEITEEGKFKVTNAVEELFDLLVQFLERTIDEMTEQGELDTTNTIWGPMQPNNFLAYQNLKILYTTLKTKMETLKG